MKAAAFPTGLQGPDATSGTVDKLRQFIVKLHCIESALDVRDVTFFFPSFC